MLWPPLSFRGGSRNGDRWPFGVVSTRSSLGGTVFTIITRNLIFYRSEHSHSSRIMAASRSGLGIFPGMLSCGIPSWTGRLNRGKCESAAGVFLEVLRRATHQTVSHFGDITLKVGHLPQSWTSRSTSTASSSVHGPRSLWVRALEDRTGYPRDAHGYIPV